MTIADHHHVAIHRMMIDVVDLTVVDLDTRMIATLPPATTTVLTPMEETDTTAPETVTTTDPVVTVTPEVRTTDTEADHQLPRTAQLVVEATTTATEDPTVMLTHVVMIVLLQALVPLVPQASQLVEATTEMTLPEILTEDRRLTMVWCPWFVQKTFCRFSRLISFPTPFNIPTYLLCFSGVFQALISRGNIPA